MVAAHKTIWETRTTGSHQSVSQSVTLSGKEIDGQCHQGAAPQIRKISAYQEVKKKKMNCWSFSLNKINKKGKIEKILSSPITKKPPI